MIMTVLALGGTLLGATAIAGLLMVYQLHSTSDVGNSAKAIFAADTGIEWGIYQFFKPTSTDPAPVLSNGATFTVTCYDVSSAEISCRNASTVTVHSVGQSHGSYRAFELNL